MLKPKKKKQISFFLFFLAGGGDPKTDSCVLFVTVRVAEFEGRSRSRSRSHHDLMSQKEEAFIYEMIFGN